MFRFIRDKSLCRQQWVHKILRMFVFSVSVALFLRFNAPADAAESPRLTSTRGNDLDIYNVFNTEEKIWLLKSTKRDAQPGESALKCVYIQKINISMEEFYFKRYFFDKGRWPSWDLLGKFKSKEGQPPRIMDVYVLIEYRAKISA
uniref:Uncharacterized protein n=1 Tax=Amblyomma triste TaxID=251400 RepID=A0A023G8M6_AMBTT